LSGFPLKWDATIDDRLWDDFVQEETRRLPKTGGHNDGGDDAENFSLATKGKSKVKGSGRSASMKDKRKLKCFAHHKTNHYVSQCPYKKKKENQVVASASTKIDDFKENFKK